MLFRLPRKRTILVCVCGRFKNWGKKQNINPMWKVLMKDVDLGEPTSFPDHVYLGCTSRECQISKDIVDSYRNMFESRISAWAMENSVSEKSDANISSWAYQTEGHAKKCEERYCELASKTSQQQHSRNTKRWNVGELSKVCSHIVLKCLFLARIGRPDIYGP